MNIKKLTLIIILFIFFFGNVSFPSAAVKADSLQDNIQEQVGKIDFNEYEKFFNSLNETNNLDFFSFLNNLLKGEYSFEYSSIFEYLINLALDDLFDIIPVMINIVAIAILCGIVQQIRNSFLTDGVAEITYFVCIMGILLLISSELIIVIQNCKNAINSLSILTEIMSPIILTLMASVGAKVSVSVYTPTVAFLSNGVIVLVSNIILPLVGAITVINILSNFSDVIKINKLSELFSTIIKWLFGIIATVYGLFLSVQGIAVSIFDGISIKTAKYAISNTVPIVGGLLKDGLDLVLAGSVIIKNSVGVISIFLMLLITVSPIIYLTVFSLLLKTVSAIIEPISDARISNICTSISKSLEYVIACVLLVGFMFFVTVLLMIFSANTFI